MKNRFVLGLLILLAAAAALAAGPNLCEFLGLCTRPTILVRGYIGGSKDGLLKDLDVQRILKDRYGVEVSYTTLGGGDQVCGLKPEDFVWPGTEIAVEKYKACNGGKAGKGVEYVLISPIVFYSWEKVTDALAAQDLLAETNGIAYLDLPRFTPVLMEGRPWQDIGRPDLYGNLNVASTDPANSNSGQVWAALLATMLNRGRVPDAPAVNALLPDVKKYFDRQGFMEKKSTDLFKKYMLQGMGGKPIIVDYESLLPDYIYQNQTRCDDLIRMGVRVIYPRPTVWASHPLIAVTDNGVKLQKALLDPDIQKLAWERHGFRAPLGKVPEAQAANCLKVPDSIVSTISLPQASVMDGVISYLGN